MKDWRSLAYTKLDFKYRMVLIPKYRHKVFFAKSRKHVGKFLRELCRYKGIELSEGNAQPNHTYVRFYSSQIQCVNDHWILEG
jgi:putative transposase